MEVNGAIPLLEARGLRVVAGGNLLLDVPSLTLGDGEVLSLIGPNGAGKSTLLLALAALTLPTAGEVLFRGRPTQGNRAVNLAYRRSIGLVFQEAMLLDTTVFNNVAAGLRIRGVPRPEIERRVGANLERFRIGHLRHRLARTLSGGEAQRASLARALAVEPEILLMDEPFSALDPPTRESLMDDLERTLRETRTAVIFVTHDRLEALRLADRVAVMNGGRILQEGPPDEVMNSPVDEFVASFVGVETVLEGTVSSGHGGCFTARVGEREFEAVGDVPEGERVLLCIRPENVTLAIGPPTEHTSARNIFKGVVERVVPLGPYQRVTLNCGFPLTALVTNHSAEELALRPGTVATVVVKATAIHVIRKSGGIR